MVYRLTAIPPSAGLLVVCLAVTLAILPGGIARASKLDSLRIGRDEYPRVFFFRQSESWAANQRVTYKSWEGCFERLMGIEGKVLEEEVPGRSIRNIDFFTRFKKRHPDQLVLLHYNGNARDPRFESGRFFAGHWVYYNGARILSDVPAGDGETEIRLSDASLFRTGIGRYRDANEDIGLCMLDGQGRPNWNISEQVQLVSVDPGKKSIRVRRACYGTSARAFPAGRAYAAAHVTEGPWGRKSNLLWFYNYSTRCPADANGRTCADVHVNHLAELFAPAGPINAFDGLEFDVLHNRCGGAGRGRGPDCDADGVMDGGVFDGINSYGIGVIEFCRKLRRRLGENILILADGHSVNNQRAFGLLNGIESEGWPALRDEQILDWSGGLNRHFFWDRSARRPAFSYINHKFIMPTGRPGVVARPDVPFNIHRLVFSAGVFTNSAICYSFAPPASRGELLGIWDEFCMGGAARPGWLGKPLGPPVRMAEMQPDVLGAVAKDFGPAIMSRLDGNGVRFARENRALKVRARDAAANEIRFILRDIPCKGPDLFVTLTARGAQLPGYPAEYARLMHVGIAPDQRQLVRAEMPETGMYIRRGDETPIDPESGAIVRFQQNVTIDGRPRDTYFVHPPYKSKRTGYTYWQRELSIDRDARLDFHLGMGPKSPARSDGVTFIVLIARTDGAKPTRWSEIFRHTQKEHRWTHHTVDLGRWAGKTVRLKFVSDCGPKNNTTTDQSYWADVFVLGPEGSDGLTEPVRYMTWCSGKDFSSGFYFSQVKGQKASLEFTVEGGAPVWISGLSAHAHADAVFREFEHGLVLANPSPRSYAFDLGALLPGRKFRRIRATSRQDTRTNDGSPVSGRIVLGPKDALFLVRRKDIAGED